MLISAIIYTYINYAADTVKIWDYSCYYRMSLSVREIFSDGLLSGLNRLKRTIWYDEYNLFLLMFTITPFELSTKNFEAFYNSYFIVFVIPVIYSFMCILRRVIKELDLKKVEENITFIAGCTLIVTFPLLHATSTKGMPDIGGLLFIALIFMLAYDYSFERTDIQRITLLGILSIAVFLYRRWYTFWLVGFYLTYFLYCIVTSIKKNRTIIRRIVLYSLVMIACVFIFFGPLVKRILLSDIINKYGAYNFGGLGYEIKNQFKNLGIFTTGIILIGIVYGVLENKLRKLTILTCGSSIVAMLLFTRVQNMGIHQSLLLVPLYIHSGICAIICCMKSSQKTIRTAGCCFIMFCICFNFFAAFSSLNISNNNHIWGKISLKPEIRKDQVVLTEVNAFIEKNCSEEEKIYMILGSAFYNPEVFKNYYLPDKKLDTLIMSEHSVDLTHGFPEEFFLAKYVLVSDPIQEGAYSEPQLVIRELDKALGTENSISKKFSLVHTIKGDNINFYIYKRELPVDNQEIDYFKNVFSKYYDLYPELYRDRMLPYYDIG